MIFGFVLSFGPAPEGEGRLLFVVGRRGLLVRSEGQVARLPEESDLKGLELRHASCFGVMDGQACVAAPVPTAFEPPPGLALRPLRSLFGLWSDRMVTVAGQAAQVVDFERTHRFCGGCGRATEPVPGERARRCAACDLTDYPRISPAVIVLVRKGSQALLARAAHFPLPFFSTLAGFVEIGETLEDTIAR